MNIQEALTLFGLTENEVKIYLALLDLGESTAQQITKKTGIIRQTIYDTIDKLKARGLVSETIISNVNHYSASPPEVLNEIEEERRTAIAEITPELKKRQLISTGIPKVQAFVGLKGLKNLTELTLQAKTDNLWAANEQVANELFKEHYWDNLAKKRIEKKIQLKYLHDSETKGAWPSNKTLYREVRSSPLLNKSDVAFTTFDDKTILFTMKNDELFGIYIQSAPITAFFNLMFSNMWKQAARE
jgi:sugar-specific transcriptional regulator TrmB